jgi:hypothetical protein
MLAEFLVQVSQSYGSHGTKVASWMQAVKRYLAPLLSRSYPV